MVARRQAASVLDEVLAFNRDRKAKRVRLKLQRMNQNAFAFFRGTDHLFARAWPEFKPHDVGPYTLQCGDLHLENFGGYQSDDGEFFYDVNDFDEALVAPCTLDIVRCSASILLAAELWQLTPLQATGMTLAYLDEYRKALGSAAGSESLASSGVELRQGAILKLLGATALGSQKSLLDHHTQLSRGGVRRIHLSAEQHPPIRSARAKTIRKAVQAYGNTLGNPRAFRVLDVTGRIAGIGSLGLRRYLVLIEGDGSPDANRLLDIKEVRPSALLPCTDAAQPDAHGNDAQRVVEAQRTLQAKPTRGLDVIEIDGEWFRMREMIADENRSSLDRLQRKPEKLREAIEVAGRLTGWSHLRGVPKESRSRHHESLLRWASGPALDAVIASAARCAERTRLDFSQFHAAMSARGALPKALRPKPSVR